MARTLNSESAGNVMSAVQMIWALLLAALGAFVAAEDEGPSDPAAERAPAAPALWPPAPEMEGDDEGEGANEEPGAAAPLAHAAPDSTRADGETAAQNDKQAIDGEAGPGAAAADLSAGAPSPEAEDDGGVRERSARATKASVKRKSSGPGGRRTGAGRR